MIPAEVRAHLAATLAELSRFQSPLVARLIFPDPLTVEETASLTQATADSRYCGLRVSGGDRHLSFVDDTGNAGIPEKIIPIVNGNIVAAYVIFGFPNETPYRQEVVNSKKWIDTLLPTLLYLGFCIDSRPLTVTWPLDKRQKLSKMLDDQWLNVADPILSPRDISKLMGLIRNSALVSVFGVYSSLQIQYCLTDAIRKELKVKYKGTQRTKHGKR
jgi:hypothetical protein